MYPSACLLALDVCLTCLHSRHACFVSLYKGHGIITGGGEEEPVFAHSHGGTPRKADPAPKPALGVCKLVCAELQVVDEVCARRAQEEVIFDLDLEVLPLEKGLARVDVHRVRIVGQREAQRAVGVGDEGDELGHADRPAAVDVDGLDHIEDVGLGEVEPEVPQEHHDLLAVDVARLVLVVLLEGRDVRGHLLVDYICLLL